MVELRTETQAVIRRLREGERLRLTYRNRPLAVLVPEGMNESPEMDDPLYTFHEEALATDEHFRIAGFRPRCPRP